MAKKKHAISPTREENYPEWYQQVIKASDLAEHSPVRGCMVIKPWGYRLWENIKRFLDDRFKETGHENAYFPLFIPLSYLQREAEHVDGFAKECAVVTHHRLEKDEKGNLVPGGELEEPLVVRPTSETIIGETFAKWVESYRDLPILINQWANIVRWEMRTRLFLRTAEILWQEGHTVHATQEEAIEEAEKMLGVYVDIAQNHLAIPVFHGRKTEFEKFPGAVTTYCFEGMMQDGKALQMGTSHFLGQNFSKSSNIQFTSKEGSLEYGWTTSWGVSTRLIGSVIMVHSDDDGLVLPPRIAPSHVVIIPVIHSDDAKAKVMEYCDQLKAELKQKFYMDRPLEVIIDNRELRAGEKSWSWVKKGIPIRVEVGPREIDDDNLSVFRRNRGAKERESMSRKDFLAHIKDLLEEMQKEMFQKALSFRNERVVKIDTKEEFYEFFSSKNKNEGFALVHYNPDHNVEDKLQADLNVTVRCIPNDLEKEEGVCPFTGEKSSQRVIYGKSY